jgi:beta-galactosidase
LGNLILSNSCIHYIQVEVKIDRLQDTSIDNVLTNYTIEATLFDSGSWESPDGNPDLLASKVADITFQPTTAPLGFYGYTLVGKLQSPKLWSAEQVRNFNHFYVYG